MGNNAIQNAFRGYNFGIPNPVEIKLDFSKRIYYATDMRRDTNLIAVKGGYSDLQTELKNTYDFYVSKQVGAKGSHIGATVPIAWGLLGQGEWKWQKFWFSTGKAGVPYLSLRYWTDTTYEVGMTMQRALTGGTAAADAADTLDAYIKDGRLIADTKTKGRLKVAGGTLIRTVRGAVSTLLSMLDFGASEYILTDQFVPNLGIEALMAMSWFDGTAGEGTSTSNAITVTSHNAVQEELVLSPRILFYLLADKIWKNYYKVWKEKKATRPLKNIMWDLAPRLRQCLVVGLHPRQVHEPPDEARRPAPASLPVAAEQRVWRALLGSQLHAPPEQPREGLSERPGQARRLLPADPRGRRLVQGYRRTVELRSHRASPLQGLTRTAATLRARGAR